MKRSSLWISCVCFRHNFFCREIMTLPFLTRVHWFQIQANSFIRDALSFWIEWIGLEHICSEKFSFVQYSVAFKFNWTWTSRVYFYIYFRIFFSSEMFNIQYRVAFKFNRTRSLRAILCRSWLENMYDNTHTSTFMDYTNKFKTKTNTIRDKFLRWYTKKSSQTE